MSTIEHIISRLKPAFDQNPPDEKSDDIAYWRDRIDALDQALLLLLNERSECANTIGEVKKKLKLPIYVPEREKIVLENVLKANLGPLDDIAVRGLFERIIDETRSLERRKFQNLD